jgi:hypothetical protein
MAVVVLTADQAAVGPWPAGTLFRLEDGEEWEELALTPTRVRLRRREPWGEPHTSYSTTAGDFFTQVTVTAFRLATKYVDQAAAVEIVLP